MTTETVITNTDSGSEGPFPTPPLKTVVQLSKVTSDGKYKFKYTAAGRPNALADSVWSGAGSAALAGQASATTATTFSEVKYRKPNNRWIYHTVEGTIDLKSINFKDDSANIDAKITGSKFPTHALFIQGKRTQIVEQNNFAELWKLPDINNILKK